METTQYGITFIFILFSMIAPISLAWIIPSIYSKNKKSINEIDKNKFSLIKYSWLYIIIGLIEVTVSFSFTFNVLTIIPGLITIISAYLMRNPKRIKWGYYVGIWALLKHNLLGLALIGSVMHLAISRGSSIKIFHELIPFIILPIGLVSSILGVIVIILTSRQIRLIKNQGIDSEILL